MNLNAVYKLKIHTTSDVTVNVHYNQTVAFATKELASEFCRANRWYGIVGHKAGHWTACANPLKFGAIKEIAACGI